MRRRTTSHDVARMAGVSQSTVSLVLNERPDTRIPEATRQRVFEAARQLNYTRNVAARALLTGRTHRLGIVPIHPQAFTDQGYYYGTLMTSFLGGGLRHSYDMLLFSADHGLWEGLYRDILGGSADGVILIGRPSNDPLTLALLHARFPTVTVSYQPDAEGFHSVDCDNEGGGRMAVQHLLDLGHRRFAFIQPCATNSWEVQRLTGAQSALRDAGLAPSSLQILPYRDWHTSPHDLVEALCVPPASERSTAIICRDEWLAEALSLALRDRGLKVPHDVALINFNSTQFCERTSPPLTAVGQPLAEIGAAAVDLLVHLVEGKEVKPGTQRFPMRLDIRESCGAYLGKGA